MKSPIPVVLLCVVALFGVRGFAQMPAFELKDGDRVIFVGDALIEAEQRHGWIEVMLTTRFPERNVTFRNLGWNGDTPAGISREGLSLVQAGREPADEGWRQLVKQITDAKPTVVFVGYGMASSFEGATNTERFAADYAKLLDAIATVAPGVRLVLLGPIRHEDLGAPWPNPEVHNRTLAGIDTVIATAARTRQLPYISLFQAMQRAVNAGSAEKWTENGVLPNATGYRALATAISDALFGTVGEWPDSPHTEALREAILRKNEAFFHRSRPANMAYIFGFRSLEQGQNAGEVAQFEQAILAEEKRISALRALKPANVPPVPLRLGNLNAPLTPQPKPEFEVAEGLEITLWAENPMLHKPIHMNFDARGRLWVASSEVYPQIEPGQAATDKIIILEDTDGTGRADKATVFADGLIIPTGVVPTGNGAYVAQGTDLLYLEDTDGDGSADRRHVFLSGFGTEDTHHNIHGPHWGPDGRMYLTQSVYTRSNTETPHGVVRLKAGGIFRLDPRDQSMEVLFRGFINSWGHQIDDYGQSFATDGAGFDGLSWAYPGATYLTLAPARRQLQSISPGHNPKLAGLEIVRSELFPADWQGDMVTCDFRAHRIVRFKVSDQGSGYVSHEPADVLRTPADSFRPIDIKHGPDGALYVADWSNPIIQHGEVDFRDPRRDKVHGRIWRIAPKGRLPLARTDFTQASTDALLDKLVSPNGYEQEKANRELVERGAAAVLPALEAWTMRQTTSFALVRAMWIYQAFNRPQTALLERLLGDRDARVRAAALRALPAEGALPALAKLVADENPRVRLEAVRALGRQKTAEAAMLALGILDRPMDPFLDYALWLTMNELAEPWIAAVKSGSWTVAGNERALEFALKSIEPSLASDALGRLLATKPLAADGSGPWLELVGSAGGAKELRLVFAQVLQGGFDEAARTRALTALSEAARLRNVTPEGDLSGLETLLGSHDAAVRLGALQVAATWKAPRFVPTLLRLAGGPGTPAAERTAALVALREIGGPDVIAGLKQLIANVPTARREAVLALAALELPAALPSLVALLQTTAAHEAEAVWRAILSVRDAGARLATELASAELSKEVARAGLQPAREGAQNRALVPVLMEAAGLALSSLQLSAAEMRTLANEALVKGDAARGERIYRRPELACMVCHAIGGAGGKVGPDLGSIGASAPPDYLVESLLYPNAKIKEGYHTVLITRRNGQEFSGLVVKEDASQLVLRDGSNNEISIATQDIARRGDMGSLMPPGLIDALLPDERLDLVKFMSQLGKPGDYDAPKGDVAMSWKLYLVTDINEHIGTERVAKGDLTLADWKPALSLVNGTLPREEIDTAFASMRHSRGLFAATQFESGRGGAVNFTMTGKVKSAWVNGRLLERGETWRADAKQGLNTLVIQLEDTMDGASVRSGEVTFIGF